MVYDVHGTTKKEGELKALFYFQTLNQTFSASLPGDEVKRFAQQASPFPAEPIDTDLQMSFLPTLLQGKYQPEAALVPIYK